jgi:2-C-methyl-D-erythritol 4-phosphate cytidylyltransferase/2-C-methyl-D-erythritol 2,4-cyclodiphosphate synthase
MDKVPELAIVVVAAGRGSRAGGTIPKQYKNLAGRPLLAHTLGALMRAAPGATILPVIHSDDLDLYQSSAASFEASAGLAQPVFGGTTRQASVRLGLEALAGQLSKPNIVLIHDAVRLFISDTLVNQAVAAAKTNGAAVPGVKLAETIKEIDADGNVAATLPRTRLRAVQTPQAFRFDLILNAHRSAAAKGILELTDDAAVAEWAGHRVHVFAGEDSNMKVTTSKDLAIAEARLLGDLADIRTGQGYDVHAFGPGAHVWLGGLKIAHDHGLIGALADGDIGSHFPPSDPKWRGAASSIFLAAAAAKVRSRGGVIAHIDATLVCERPKMGPHRDAIRASIARTAEIPLDRVAIKATTSEGLGFTGREEGIASLAVATIRLPL